MKSILTIVCLVFVAAVHGQTFSEKITKELAFEKKSTANALIVSNVNGNISIVGYSGDKILVEAQKTINAKTDARLTKGKEEVQVQVIDDVDTLVVYVKDGCTSYHRYGWKEGSGRWGNNWNCNNNCNIEYDYTVHLTIKVPSTVNVVASTINDGDVTIEGMSAVVKANNINGSIKLTSLRSEAVASTINGDVDIFYAANPNTECRFYSLNGDINATFQKGLAAEMSFESFNGNFYTNIDRISQLPVKVEQSKEGEELKYKISDSHYKIGNGGTAYLDFETFNGDVYLKEIE